MPSPDAQLHHDNNEAAVDQAIDAAEAERKWKAFVRSGEAKPCDKCRDFGYYRIGPKEVYCRRCWGEETGQWPDGKPEAKGGFDHRLGDEFKALLDQYAADPGLLEGLEGACVAIVERETAAWRNTAALATGRLAEAERKLAVATEALESVNEHCGAQNPSSPTQMIEGCKAAVEITHDALSRL